MEEILNYCGFDNPSQLLRSALTPEEIDRMWEDMVDSPDDAKDFVMEEIERIAKELYEWVDHDAIIASEEDRQYQKYRDGEQMENLDECKKIKERLEDLERKAANLYIDNTEWEYIIEALDEDERKEYDDLSRMYEELCGI